jgi:hypothetical protein
MLNRNRTVFVQENLLIIPKKQVSLNIETLLQNCEFGTQRLAVMNINEDEYLFDHKPLVYSYDAMNSMSTINSELASQFKLSPLTFPVFHYAEQLYLEHALIVSTFTTWKFLVIEDNNSVSRQIRVTITGDFEPFNESVNVSIPITTCQSVGEYENISKTLRDVPDAPSWRAFKLPSIRDSVRVLKKPTRSS